MSKPKSFDSWTPEKQAEWKRKAYAQIAAAKAKKPDKYREIQNIGDKRRRRENPEHQRELDRQARLRNPQRGRKASSKWSKKNTESINRRRRQRYSENPEIQRSLRNRWANENIDAVRQSQRRSREKVSDAYLASIRGMSVEHLRQYPRPVIELWKTLLKLSRIRKQINTEINEIEKRNE